MFINMSFGEKMVWISFNPSWDDSITEIKSLYAEIINLCRDEIVNWECSDVKIKFLEKSIEEAITAQMWAVKWLTFDIERD